MFLATAMRVSAFWHTPLCLAPRQLYPLLTTTGSLTKQIEAQFGPLRVQQISESWQLANQDEAQILNLRTKRTGWIRNVVLFQEETPLVYAHSVVTRSELKTPFRLIRQAGKRPLGALLFSNPRIQRSAIAWRRLDHRHPLWQAIHIQFPTIYGTLWARRSLFQLLRHQLLVTEVFLPALSAPNISCPDPK